MSQTCAGSLRRARRAVTTWRLLLETDPTDGRVNMARDRAIQLAHARGIAPPTLRIYGWSRPTVSIGRFQRSTDVDRAACDAAGVGLVRRFTGGRGVLHDDEITYSVVAGVQEGLPRSVSASYRVLCGMLVEAYAILGVSARLTARTRGDSRSPACYLHATQADVSVGDAKLSGSAQVWYEGTVLQHGSIVRDRDAEWEARIFGLDVRDARALKAETVTLKGLLGNEAPDNDAIAAALVAGFERTFGVEIQPGSLTGFEAAREKELVLSAGML